jgi:hypothetical protein
MSNLLMMSHAFSVSPGAPTEESVWGLGEAIEKSPTQQAIPEFTFYSFLIFNYFKCFPVIFGLIDH